MIATDGGEARPLTNLRGEVDQLAWSPDGRTISVGWRKVEDIGADDPHVEPAVRHSMRLWAIDADTGAMQPLIPDGLEVYEYAWSPDGKRLALVANPDDNTGSGWYTARLYVVDVNSPDDARVLFAPPRQICALVWSPDSREVAFLTSLISDQPLWSGEVWIVSADGGEPRQITGPDVPLSFTKLFWKRPDELVYCARQSDGTSFGRLRLPGGEIEPLWADYAMIGDWWVPRISLAADGNSFAAALELPDAPPQVWYGQLDRANQPWTQLSQLSYTPLLLGHMTHTRWTSFDGLEIGGQVVYPVGYEPGRRYPLFVQIHGGPAWSWLPHYMVWWEWWAQLLAGRGYAVFLPNIRGSTGRGTAYTEANFADMGGGDWQDILTGIDHLIEQGLADPDRLGIGGWSYGGYMTAWAITQTTRFKAAIMGAGIANWESYYAQNGIRGWQTAFFGASPYDDFALNRRFSPIAYIREARTPTLILHGQADTDVPVAQAHEMFAALTLMGVETQLVTYPRERHPILERAHQLDLLQRVADWCDRHLKETA